MSLSRPTSTNPAARFYQWSGSRGQLEYYDKEKGENIAVKLPFKFIVLDELHTVSGYSDQDQSGFWSNEVRKTTEDFTVRTKRGIKYVGPYKNSQGIVQMPQGAKYAKSVYIAHMVEGEWTLANLKLSGAALTAWIELSSHHKTEGNVTALTGSTEGTKGATKFQVPVFQFGGAPTADVLEIATKLDDQLQTYLDTYLSAPKYDDGEPVNDTFDDLGKATPEQQADFEQRKAAAKQKSADSGPGPTVPDDVLPDFDDSEPINLDDIPF